MDNISLTSCNLGVLHLCPGMDVGVGEHNGRLTKIKTIRAFRKAHPDVGFFPIIFHPDHEVARGV
jgi:hypothetical protein